MEEDDAQARDRRMTCLHCDNGAYVQEVEGELYVVPCPWCADMTANRRSLRRVLAVGLVLLALAAIAWWTR